MAQESIDSKRSSDSSSSPYTPLDIDRKDHLPPPRPPIYSIPTCLSIPGLPTVSSSDDDTQSTILSHLSKHKNSHLLSASKKAKKHAHNLTRSNTPGSLSPSSPLTPLSVLEPDGNRASVDDSPWEPPVENGDDPSGGANDSWGGQVSLAVRRAKNKLSRLGSLEEVPRSATRKPSTESLRRSPLHHHQPLHHLHPHHPHHIHRTLSQRLGNRSSRSREIPENDVLVEERELDSIRTPPPITFLGNLTNSVKEYANMSHSTLPQQHQLPPICPSANRTSSLPPEGASHRFGGSPVVVSPPTPSRNSSRSSSFSRKSSFEYNPRRSSTPSLSFNQSFSPVSPYSETIRPSDQSFAFPNPYRSPSPLSPSSPLRQLPTLQTHQLPSPPSMTDQPVCFSPMSFLSPTDSPLLLNGHFPRPHSVHQPSLLSRTTSATTNLSSDDDRGDPIVQQGSASHSSPDEGHHRVGRFEKLKEGCSWTGTGRMTGEEGQGKEGNVVWVRLWENQRGLVCSCFVSFVS